MRFATIIHQRQFEVVVERDGSLFRLPQLDSQQPRSLKSLITHWDEWQPLLEQATLTDSSFKESNVRFAPPIPNPGKIICVGLNYADHAKETGAEVPALPVIFNKFPSALNAHQQPIFLPSISNQVDYEGELVVVIGRRGRFVSEADAMKHVFGYCCGHDVSARDWQKGKPGGQWLLGKTFDTFAPCGPYVTTANEINRPDQLDIELRLNGNVMQKSNTSQFIYKLPYLLSHLSKFCTLEPGDLIFTGTPSGVGVARNPPVFLKPGDQVEVEIEGLGILRNPVLNDPAESEMMLASQHAS
jgi:2-keto-4-pentenoate hydratase/2-oxohepta-3-ene-1,7-dioic acid hydratase in catechol pathway